MTTDASTEREAPSLAIRLPMQDGARLSTSVWLPPDATGPVPVILLRSPYGEHIVSWPRLRSILRYREAGFAVVFQVTRGMPGSEGVFSMHGPFERSDGHETIEWVAAQPWCDGAVGMDGSSYLAMTQLCAAIGRSPHLKCIVPAVPSADWFREPPYPGGCFARQHTLSWTGLLNTTEASQAATVYITATGMLSQPDKLARMRSRPLADSADGALTGDKLAHYRDVLAHPTLDDWWRQRTLQPGDYARIGVPALVVNGNFDYAVGALVVWRGLDTHGPAGVERQLLIGPWDHGQCYGGGGSRYGPYAWPDHTVLDLQAERVAFFKRHLMGIQTDPAPQPGERVRVFITGANTWRAFDRFPPREVKQHTLYLHSGGHANGSRSDGTLSAEPAATAEPADHCRSDPTLPFMAALSAADPVLLLDLRERERHGETLVYATAPLPEALTLLGEPEAVIHLAADAPDCDLIVWLAEQRADGQLVQLAFGALRLRYHQGFEREVLLTPGVPVQARVTLSYIGHQVPAGSRLKLLLGGDHFPLLDPNPNTGEPIASAVAMRAVERTVLHDDQHASRIEVPVLLGVLRESMK